MKQLNFIVLVFFAMHINVFACLNGESKILKNGDYLYMDHDDKLPFGHEFFEGNFEKMKFELDSLYKKTKDIAYLSDKGLILILQKQYKQALELYLDIEKTHPNRYSTASNVGTIYELIGENKKALEWINKSIRINPKSHNESEWIHSKILEAKIRGEKFFTSEFILGVNFGNEKIPFTSLNESEIYKLYKSIYYQLNERTSFIQPKDKIISVLLFELGNISILKKDFRNAKAIFEKSKEYGFVGDLLDKRLEFVNENLKTKKTALQSKVQKSKTEKENTDEINLPKTIFLILGIILGIFALLLLFKKKKSTTMD
ncbi:MAG: tetratricopeptide repeat protein [Limnohabitans sp.]|nr:tetratricopeptide repeat protein [Limnohabitans sp.]